MHLADGILSSVPVALSLNACGAIGVALSVRQLERQSRQLAWTGTLAGFVFAAQALNLPLVPGASAHAIGAGLLTLAVGPARAVVALFAVLVAQALLLADGGFTVLGINALNLAVVPALTVYACRRVFGESKRGLALSALFGTALGSAAGACVLTFALVTGAHAPLGLTAAWLIGVQSVAGLIEGALTAVIVQKLYGRAPALLIAPARGSAPLALDARIPAATPDRRALKLAAVALAILLVLVPLASTRPDALELVLERLQAGR